MSSKFGFAYRGLPATATVPTVSASARAPKRAADRGWLDAIRLAAAVAQERRALAAADPATLRDLGLTEEQAQREAARPFWDMPAGRR